MFIISMYSVYHFNYRISRMKGYMTLKEERFPELEMGNRYSSELNLQG